MNVCWCTPSGGGCSKGRVSNVVSVATHDVCPGCTGLMFGLLQCACGTGVANPKPCTRASRNTQPYPMQFWCCFSERGGHGHPSTGQETSVQERLGRRWCTFMQWIVGCWQWHWLVLHWWPPGSQWWYSSEWLRLPDCQEKKPSAVPG
jgi:hypothetical protein